MNLFNKYYFFTMETIVPHLFVLCPEPGVTTIYIPNYRIKAYYNYSLMTFKKKSESSLSLSQVRVIQCSSPSQVTSL